MSFIKLFKNLGLSLSIQRVNVQNVQNVQNILNAVYAQNKKNVQIAHALNAKNTSKDARAAKAARQNIQKAVNLVNATNVQIAMKSLKALKALETLDHVDGHRPGPGERNGDTLNKQIALLKSNRKLNEIYCQMQKNIRNSDRNSYQVINPEFIEKALDECEKSKETNFYT